MHLRVASDVSMFWFLRERCTTSKAIWYENYYPTGSASATRKDAIAIPLTHFRLLSPSDPHPQADAFADRV